MNRRITTAVKLVAAIAAISISPLVRADDTAPAASENKDIIIVHPNASDPFHASHNAYAVAVGSPINGTMREGKMVKAAYLGVGVSGASEVLTEQLKLPQGVGLVVEFVEKDSPAEKAGLQAHDIIHKVDDQLMINVQQLAVLVRTYKPGDGVKLTVIRKGEVMTLNASLIEKELPALSMNSQQWEFSSGLPRVAAAPMPPIPPMVSGMLNMENGDHDVTVGKDRIRSRVIRVMPNSSSTIIKVDDDGQRIELQSRDGKKTLKIVDKDGKSLFDGPFTTDEEKAKLPAELHDKVKSLEEGIELKEVPATSPSEPKADAEDPLMSGPNT